MDISEPRSGLITSAGSVREIGPFRYLSSFEKIQEQHEAVTAIGMNFRL